jgi:hypothetical protein
MQPTADLFHRRLPGELQAKWFILPELTKSGAEQSKPPSLV